MKNFRSIAFIAAALVAINIPGISAYASKNNTRIPIEEPMISSTESASLTKQRPIEALVDTTSSEKELQTIVASLENPIDGNKYTEDFYIKGWAVGKDKISKIDVYLDDKISGQATYGITRTDIGSKYSAYPNASTSGFKYSFKGVSNGIHTIKVVIVDTNNNTKEITAKVNISNVKTPIMGKGTLTKNQMINSLRAYNKEKSFSYISNFVDATINEASIEGVNHDILFNQMMLETNYLRFTGDVKDGQNNFAGIGATGGVPGNSFATVEEGVRAVVQHLKAYASTEALKQPCVDPRFKYVTRGCATYLEHLGIKENPNEKGWATGAQYGYNILKFIDRSRQQSSELKDISFLSTINVSGNGKINSPVTISAIANPIAESLYKFSVNVNGVWKVISDYSNTSTATFIPNEIGTYRIRVEVKNKKSIASNADDFMEKTYSITYEPISISSFNVEGNTIVGGSLTMRVSSNRNNDSLYQYWIFDKSTNSMTMVSDYTTAKFVRYVPQKPGDYNFIVYVKNKTNNSNEHDDYRVITKTITPGKVGAEKAKVQSFNVEGNTNVGGTLTLKATATPNSEALYKFWVCDRTTNKWTMISEYSSKNIVTFTPTTSGRYSFIVHVKSKYSTAVYEEDYKGIDLIIK